LGDFMNMNEKLKQLRKTQGLTQKELADKADVSREAIVKYERGERQPPLDIAQRLAVALDVPLSDLAGQKESGNVLTNWFDNLEDNLGQVGYSIGLQEDRQYGEQYQWINYPDGTLEVCDDELKELHDSIGEYVRFKLEELKKKRVQNFKPKRGTT
jgi:transcriptional regulator with XRE-family HTH domain